MFDDRHHPDAQALLPLLLGGELGLEPDAHHGDGLELPPLGVGVLLLDVRLQLLGVGGAVAAVLADVVADLVVADLVNDESCCSYHVRVKVYRVRVKIYRVKGKLK